jgi:hypothetical protein
MSPLKVMVPSAARAAIGEASSAPVATRVEASIDVFTGMSLCMPCIEKRRGGPLAPGHAPHAGCAKAMPPSARITGIRARHQPAAAR